MKYSHIKKVFNIFQPESQMPSNKIYFNPVSAFLYLSLQKNSYFTGTGDRRSWHVVIYIALSIYLAYYLPLCGTGCHLPILLPLPLPSSILRTKTPSLLPTPKGLGFWVRARDCFLYLLSGIPPYRRLYYHPPPPTPIAGR